MSLQASRQHQLRRDRKKLRAAQQDLGERQIDLAAYERVITDMMKQALSPFSGSQALASVTGCRDAARLDCARLEEAVADLTTLVSP